MGRLVSEEMASDALGIVVAMGFGNVWGSYEDGAGGFGVCGSKICGGSIRCGSWGLFTGSRGDPLRCRSCRKIELSEQAVKVVGRMLVGRVRRWVGVDRV